MTCNNNNTRLRNAECWIYIERMIQTCTITNAAEEVDLFDIILCDGYIMLNYVYNLGFFKLKKTGILKEKNRLGIKALNSIINEEMWLIHANYLSP